MWSEQPVVVSLDQVTRVGQAVTGVVCNCASKWEKDLESHVSDLTVTTGSIAVIHRTGTF